MGRAHRVAVAALTVGIAAVVSSGCANSDDAASGANPTTAARRRSTTTVRPATTTSTRPPAPKSPITLAFGGDVHFEGPLRTALAVNPAGVLSGIAPVLQRADIAMVNLETAITERGTPAPKAYTFRAPASALTALAAAGVDVATEANNHSVDYGPVGLADSLAARAASKGVRVIGIGENVDDAFSPFETTVRGTRLAIIGATQVLDDSLAAAWTATSTQPGIASAKDAPRLLAAVRAARAANDTVVVFLHWGVEGAHCPSESQRSIAASLVAAGADVVVGSHSHQLEGAGFLGPSGTGFVSYGLGNFAFYTGTTTGVLTLTITGRRVDHYDWTPAYLSGGRPYPLAGAAATQANAAWQGLRSCTDLAP